MKTIRVWDNKEFCYMELQWFIGKVIGKTTEAGRFYGTWYKVALKFEGLDFSLTRNVDFAAYCSTPIGERRAWLFHSKDGKFWHMAPHDHGYSELPDIPA